MPDKEWYEKPGPVILWLAVIGCVGFLGYELAVHAKEMIIAFWTGFSAFEGSLAATLGPTVVSVTLISSIVVPVITLSVYGISKLTEDKPKFWIVAVALFLDPVFIDFFKDELGKDNAYLRIWIGIAGAVTFLTGSYFWQHSSKKGVTAAQKIRRFLAKGAALILFLLPTFVMAGYLAVCTNGKWDEFVQALNTPAKIIGFGGLLAIAIIGISLSRFYEAP